jgi:hypothetical protein
MVLRIILHLLFEHAVRQPRHGRLVPVPNIGTEVSAGMEMEDICDGPIDMDDFRSA